MSRSVDHLAVDGPRRDSAAPTGSFVRVGSLETRFLVFQQMQPIIKTEPETFDDFFPRVPPPPMNRPMNNGNNSSTLLRALIRTPQTPSLPAKKDAPLYDLLQNLDHPHAHDASLNPIDPLEQYLTPVLSQTSTMNSLSSKDDYLASLLTSDTPKSSELAILSTSKSHSSADTNRISAIAHELFQSTTNAPVSIGSTINHPAHPSALSNHLGNHSNEDFLSLLENKDFIDCLTESSTIDSILSQNSTSVMEPLFPSPMNKHSEKDEKAISEIYKTLMTSFNPGTSSSNDSSSVTTIFSSRSKSTIIVICSYVYSQRNCLSTRSDDGRSESFQ